MEWLRHLDPTLAAAIVAAIVGFASSLAAIPLKYLIDKRALRHRLKMEYEQKQREAQRELIIRYLGRLLEAASNFNYRMWNLYSGPDKESYLRVDGDFSREHYYLDTMVYRFLDVSVLVRGFEKEALYLDPRFIEQEDRELVWLLRAMRWSLTDVALFNSLNYDPIHSRDHFFSDQLRWICDDVQVEGDLLPRERLREQAANGEPVSWVYEFFDGLTSSEDRYRWDRLVVFHLLVMMFLNAFGDDTQKTSTGDLADIAARILNDEIVANLAAWLPKLGLTRTPRGKTLQSVLKNRYDPSLLEPHH